MRGLDPLDRSEPPHPTPLPYDGEREHTECAALTCPARDGSHARVAFSIVKNNRKQWIGARDHFLHLQVALFARPEISPSRPMRRGRRVGTAGSVCPRNPIRVSCLRAAVAQLPVKNRPEQGASVSHRFLQPQVGSSLVEDHPPGRCCAFLSCGHGAPKGVDRVSSFRGASEAREPGIHNHCPSLWIPALAALAAPPE